MKGKNAEISSVLEYFLFYSIEADTFKSWNRERVMENKILISLVKQLSLAHQSVV